MRNLSAFKIIGAIGAERRAKGGALFHIISHIASTGGGNEYLCIYFDQIRTLVAMATYASHRLIMEKK